MKKNSARVLTVDQHRTIPLLPDSQLPLPWKPWDARKTACEGLQ